MAGLRPIGSEKLQGMEKIARIMEIARYNENIPQRVNENKKTEYSINLADGNDYEIVREKQGYVIKKKLNESVSDYIEPMKGRKYYSSYSQALKRLNIVTKEINTLTENKEEISLFGEQKKFKLRVPKAETPTEPAPTEPAPELPPAPMPAPEGDVPTSDTGVSSTPEGGAPVPDMGGDMETPPAPEGDEMGDAPEPEGDEMGGAPEPEDEEEGGSFKMIQKLVGKLGQKLRAYSDTNEEGMSSDDVKYVINSVLSALDLTVLDEDDLDEIMSRLEGEEEDEDEEGVEPDEEGVESDEEGEMEGVEPEPPVAPEGEMGEGYDNYGDMFADRIPMQFAKGFSDKMSDMGGNATFGGELDEFEDESWFDDADKYEFDNEFDSDLGFEDSIEDDKISFRKRGPRSRISYGDIDEMFSESKIDKIINNYISEETKLKSSKKYKETKSEIKRLSESFKQERAALKFVEENPKSNFMGITNKKNLLFKEGNETKRVNTEGKVL